MKFMLHLNADVEKKNHKSSSDKVYMLLIADTAGLDCYACQNKSITDMIDKRVMSIKKNESCLGGIPQNEAIRWHNTVSEL